MALILLAHPDLDKSVANKTIIEALKNSNTDLEIRDLYALYPDFKIEVEAEKKALLRHQTIVFQYPFYWYNMPALLKQWFDKVFIHGFAYGSTGDKLKGKNFLASFTVGAFEEHYKATGKHHFRVQEFCKNLEQTAYYAQMNYIDPIYFHGSSGTSGYHRDIIIEKATAHAGKLLEKINHLEQVDLDREINESECANAQAI
ncbi:MAG: NAD(P)H-dependent oxidoreductase [Chitinophagaceae bacterium]